ncbi:MAG: hypothetical protein OEZ43_12150 [Gammaproteobacteria bacterium]|nr:hypothetical protein [Gammaproteobacteria bacterium]
MGICISLVLIPVAANDDQDAPDLAFLEFIGSWDTGDQQTVVDPFALLDVKDDQFSEFAEQEKRDE